MNDFSEKYNANFKLQYNNVPINNMSMVKTRTDKP